MNLKLSIALVSLGIALFANSLTYSMEEKKNTFSYNEFAETVYTKKLTDEQLTIFCKQLLQHRIDYWKKKLEKAQKNNDSEKIKTIPLYIRLWTDITPDDMIASCKVGDEHPLKIEGKDATGDTFSIENSSCMLTMSLFYANCPIIFLNTLHHEITHVEQRANCRTLEKKCDITLKNVNFYTNKEAQNIYEQCGKNTTVKCISSIFDHENEAEYQAIKFCHNPYMLNYMYEALYKDEQKPFGLLKALSGGYLSGFEKRTISKQYAEKHYKKYSEKQLSDMQETVNWIKSDFKGIPQEEKIEPKLTSLFSFSNFVSALFATTITVVLHKHYPHCFMNKKYAKLIGSWIVLYQTHKYISNILSKD